MTDIKPWPGICGWCPPLASGLTGAMVTCHNFLRPGQEDSCSVSCMSPGLHGGVVRTYYALDTELGISAHFTTPEVSPYGNRLKDSGRKGPSQGPTPTSSRRRGWSLNPGFHDPSSCSCRVHLVTGAGLEVPGGSRQEWIGEALTSLARRHRCPEPGEATAYTVTVLFVVCIAFPAFSFIRC